MEIICKKVFNNRISHGNRSQMINSYLEQLCGGCILFICLHFILFCKFWLGCMLLLCPNGWNLTNIVRLVRFQYCFCENLIVDGLGNVDTVGPHEDTQYGIAGIHAVSFVKVLALWNSEWRP